MNEPIHVGAPCQGRWAWQCRCKAEKPANCKTETAQTLPLRIIFGNRNDTRNIAVRCGFDITHDEAMGFLHVGHEVIVVKQDVDGNCSVERMT